MQQSAKDLAKERAIQLKAIFETLQVQLALGKADTKEIFEEQMKYRILSEYDATHDNLGISFSFGISSISNPDTVKAMATMPWIIQSAVFILFFLLIKICNRYAPLQKG